MRALLRWILVPLVGLVSLAWMCTALWIDGPALRLAAGLLAASVVATTLGAVVLVRPYLRAVAAYAVLFALVLAWWLSLEPSNDREWQAPVARTASATFEGDLVTIRNMRDFDYRTADDFTEGWATRTYDLSKLVGADLYFFYWGSPLIAHTIMSWEFADGQHLAISIETRKEKSESYSAFRGFFRQFELYYVVSDERDVVRLRTNYRGDQGYLYRLTSPPDLGRRVLLDYLRVINDLDRNPRWYNALTHNCTTTIRHHVENVAAENPWNWRILVNGHLPELMYMRGTIDTSLPLEELNQLSHINERAQAAGQDPHFSERIRVGLPGAHRVDPDR